jgi:hypothetical protein
MDSERVSSALRARLGEEGTVGLLVLLDSAHQEWKAGVTSELVALRLDMGRWRDELRSEIREGDARLREEIREGEARLREEIRERETRLREEMRSNTCGLKQDMSQLRVDILDAMSRSQLTVLRSTYAMWVGQLVAIAAIMAAMFRIYSP